MEKERRERKYKFELRTGADDALWTLGNIELQIKKLKEKGKKIKRRYGWLRVCKESLNGVGEVFHR